MNDSTIPNVTVPVKRTEESWEVGKKVVFISPTSDTFFSEYTILSKSKTMVKLLNERGTTIRIRFEGYCVGSPAWQTYYFPEDAPEVSIRKAAHLRYKTIAKIHKELSELSDELLKDILKLIEE